MKRAVLLSVLLAACATGDPVMQVGWGGGAQGKPQAKPVFPTRLSTAELPSARKIAPRLLVEGPLSAAVDLCVQPSGDTSLVRLRESSGDRRFDEAVLEDVRGWKYERSDALSCEQATIQFVP